jgi:hypothetical protein
MFNSSPGKSLRKPPYLFYFCSLLLVFLGIFVLFLAGEYFTRARLITPDMRRQGAEYYWRTQGNGYFQSYVASSENCVWEDSLTAHPYFGWVNGIVPPCINSPTNNIGMADLKDFPLIRDPNFFSVALLGGSVATQMYGDRNVWLEKELESRYISPNGKPFRVFNGAFGAWSYPNQINFLSLYGDALDGVVALDGYNELKARDLPITRPNSDMFLYVSRPGNLGWRYSVFLSLRHVRTVVLSFSALRKSFMIYLAFHRVVELAREKVEDIKERLVNKFFSFPDSWPQDQRDRWNRDKYKTYIKELKGLSEVFGIQYAHFVQPVLQIDKTLTDEEKSIVPSWFDANQYRTIFSGPSDDLRRVGVHTHSLLGVFKNERGTIYADTIHMKIDASGNSKGNEVLAKAMGEAIAVDWNLKRKPPAQK